MFSQIAEYSANCGIYFYFGTFFYKKLEATMDNDLQVFCETIKYTANQLLEANKNNWRLMVNLYCIAYGIKENSDEHNNIIEKCLDNFHHAEQTLNEIQRITNDAMKQLILKSRVADEELRMH